MENTEVKNGSLINNIVESFYKEKSKEITEGVKALFKPEDIAIKVTEKVNDLVVEIFNDESRNLAEDIYKE